MPRLGDDPALVPFVDTLQLKGGRRAIRPTNTRREALYLRCPDGQVRPKDTTDPTFVFKVK